MSLAHYLLQVNIYLVIFYCFYKMLLASETYFVLNRIYLLGSGVLSLAIPFLRFKWFVKQEVVKPIYIGVDQLNDFVAQVTIIQDNATKFNWGNLIVLIYVGGIAFFAIRLIAQLLVISKLLKNITNGTAFSFFRKKIIANNLPELEIVNVHEDIHVKQLHTLDVLFFEFIGIFTWFNPAIYLYKKTIKNIHEFLADEAAAEFQGDKDAYALLLLSQAFGVRPNTLTNGFFTKSLIKKRIFMLHKQRSRKIAILKYGIFLPLFAVMLLLSSATIRKNDHILAMASKMPLENVNRVVNLAINAPLSVVNLSPPPPALESKTATDDQSTLGNTVAANELDKEEPLNGFYNYLRERIKYPSNAIAKKLQGNTIISFAVRLGKISNVIVQNELGEGCDEEVVNEILAYNDYFQKDGNYSLKVTFKLENENTELKNENALIGEQFKALPNLVVASAIPKEEDENKVYTFVSLAKPPTYPGGMEKFYEFLSKNIKYPEAAIDNEIEGNVHVSFTVEKDGSLTDIKVERKLGFGIDEEAVRVLKTTKKWNPGVQNGRAARVKYNIPVKFSLDANNLERKSSVATIKLKTFDNENSPLLIVDNQVRDHRYTQSLNAKNIESIKALKSDEATAVYGRAAENGAIVIKSKSRKSTALTATLTNRN
jgi:TonB family protein